MRTALLLWLWLAPLALCAQPSVRLGAGQPRLQPAELRPWSADSLELRLVLPPAFVALQSRLATTADLYIEQFGAAEPYNLLSRHYAQLGLADRWEVSQGLLLALRIPNAAPGKPLVIRLRFRCERLAYQAANLLRWTPPPAGTSSFDVVLQEDLTPYTDTLVSPQEALIIRASKGPLSILRFHYRRPGAVQSNMSVAGEMPFKPEMGSLYVLTDTTRKQPLWWLACPDTARNPYDYNQWVSLLGLLVPAEEDEMLNRKAGIPRSSDYFDLLLGRARARAAYKPAMDWLNGRRDIILETQTHWLPPELRSGEGALLILLGPPTYRELLPDGQRWEYRSLPGQTGGYTFRLRYPQEDHSYGRYSFLPHTLVLNPSEPERLLLQQVFLHQIKHVTE